MSLLDDLNSDFDADTTSTSEPVAPQEISVEIPGVGGRMEVFKGANHEEVLQKIADSKRAANEFIEQLQQERNYPVHEEPQHYMPQYLAPSAEPLTADEMFALSQGRYNEVAPRLFEVATGIKSDDIVNYINQQEQFRYEVIAKEATEMFLENNLDYYTSPRNMYLMENHIQKQGWPWTEQALQASYEFLNSNGLLETFPADQEPSQMGTSMSTGLSDRLNDSTLPTVPDADYSKLSREEHRQRLIDDFNKRR